MPPKFQLLKTICCKNFYQKFQFKSPTKPEEYLFPVLHIHYLRIRHARNPEKNYSETSKFLFKAFHFFHSVANSRPVTEIEQEPASELAIEFQNILKIYRDSPTRNIELALNQCSPTVTEDLILNVLKRHHSDWKSAFIFFNWVSKRGQGFIISSVYNEIIDILGKMRWFEELTQVLGKMSKRGGLFNEETYRVLVNRYAAAHNVEEAIEVFNTRRDLGLELDLAAFQKLLMCLCRYKHVEVAETLLLSKANDFDMDIKTMNIVLNGWCELGNVHEAKRF